MGPPTGCDGSSALTVRRQTTSRHLGWDREVGRIAPGWSADVILVEGDPTQDISALRRVAMTVKRGDVYFPAEIYRDLGLEPFVEPPVIRLPAAGKASAAR